MIFHGDLSLPERISIWIQDLALRVSATIWVHSHGGSPNSWMVDFMEHTIRIPLTWMRTGGTPISGNHHIYIYHIYVLGFTPIKPISGNLHISLFQWRMNACWGPSRDSRPCFWRRRHAYPGHPKACWRWSLDGSRLWIISYHIIWLCPNKRGSPSCTLWQINIDPENNNFLMETNLPTLFGRVYINLLEGSLN